MSTIKDIIKLFVIMCIAALLLYLVSPKYQFMAPNVFALYRCNTVTGEVLAWDTGEKQWVTPSTSMMLKNSMFSRINRE